MIVLMIVALAAFVAGAVLGLWLGCETEVRCEYRLTQRTRDEELSDDEPDVLKFERSRLRN